MRHWLLAPCVLLLLSCGGAPGMGPDDILARFKSAGLEVGEAKQIEPKTYGLAPLLCQEGSRRFLIASLGEDKGGRLFVCSAEEDAGKLKAYYDELGKASALFHSWTYQNKGVLLQIPGDLEQTKAESYGKVIAELP